MVADWLFVIGISCEISGAALVAGEIYFESAEKSSMRGINYPTSDMPLEISFGGPAYTWTGGVLLGLGFVLQLVGYVVAAHNDWFILVSLISLGLAFFGGRRIAERFVTQTLYKRALRGRESLITQKYNQDT